MKVGEEKSKEQSSSSSSKIIPPQILDINDFNVVKVVNNAGIRLTVQCTRKTDGKVFYVKETYKDTWSASEVLSPEVMKLAGIVVPKNYLMINTDTHPAFNAHHEKLAKEGKLPVKLPTFAVASEAIKGFIDIGQYIEQIPEGFWRRAKDKLSQSVSSLGHAVTGLCEKFGWSAPEKRLKQHDKTTTLQRLGTDFSALPARDKALIEELLPVAQLVGDWDFLNIKGYNAGYAEGMLGKRPAKVDLGNCLEVGYQGKIKTESHNKINEPALPDDPPLAEKFKVTALAAEFREGGAMRLMSAIPRRYTIDALFPQLEKTIVSILSDSKDAGKLSDGYAKGLYRLSLMPDAAIRKTFNAETLAKKGLSHFYLEESAERLADMMIARRASLVGAGDDMGQAMRSWKNNPRNHVERLIIEREVLKAAGLKPQEAARI